MQDRTHIKKGAKRKENGEDREEGSLLEREQVVQRQVKLIRWRGGQEKRYTSQRTKRKHKIKKGF